MNLWEQILLLVAAFSALGLSLGGCIKMTRAKGFKDLRRGHRIAVIGQISGAIVAVICLLILGS